MTHHGLLLVNKPGHITSHDVVQKVRSAFGTREVGHAGTLDPLATGLMVLLIGDGTKLSDYVLNGNKAYKVKAKLGLTTDSLDITGEITSQMAVNVTAEQIQNAILSTVGTFTWPVPAFSATKIQGKKMYEWTREEATHIEAPKKEMSFWNVQISEIGHDFFTATLECSKGSFIRTWVSEIGQKLGCGATIETLERTQSAPYFLADAVSLDSLALEKLNVAELLKTPSFVPLRKALPEWPTYTIKGKDERLILNGQISHDFGHRLIPLQKAATESQKTIGIKVLSGESGDLLALLESQPNRGLKIRRVFKKT